jgi:hypothetical protein
VARKQKQKRRSGKERVSASQIQAYRARQEAVLPREEVERRIEEERRRERDREERTVERAEQSVFGGSRDARNEDQPRLTAEQIAAEYDGVRKELYRIAVLGGLSFVLLAIIAVYMNA